MGTVFSYVLIIDDKQYFSFGNLQIKQEADGMGVSGISAAEFSFTVSYEEYAKNKPRSGAEVVFGFGDESNKIYVFHVSQRSRKGGTVTFKCYDKSIFFGISSDLIDIPYVNVDEKDEKSGEINTLGVVRSIAKHFGLTCTDRINTQVWGLGQLMMKKSDIAGKTVRSLLETISTAWCGYFVIAPNYTLDFALFGDDVNTLCDVKTHSEIEMQSERSPITQVIAYTGSDYYYANLKDDNGQKIESDVLSTLTVQTDFASQEYAEMLLSRIQNYTYRSWRCSKAILERPAVLPTLSMMLNGYHFPKGLDITARLIANSMTLSFTSTGVYATLGSNEVVEDEYTFLGYISRKLEEKISDGEKLGNDTLITRYQGIVHLGEKKKDEKTGEVKQDRYGYSKATSDGVVEFTGAMKSKKYPGIALKSDLSGFKMQYEDTSFDFDVVIDGDNVTLKEKGKDGG